MRGTGTRTVEEIAGGVARLRVELGWAVESEGAARRVVVELRGRLDAERDALVDAMRREMG